MLIIAQQKNTRQSARKVRLVANAVRKLDLVKALEQLSVIERKASVVLMKVMRQAIANASHNHNLKIEDLKLQNILVNPGPTYKRFRAVSRGRAHTIQKKTCHVKVILQSKEEKVAQPKKSKVSTAGKKAVKKVSQTKSKKVAAVSQEIEHQKELTKEVATQAATSQKVVAKKINLRAQSKSTRTKNLGGRS
ncbi:MAG: 50S ribosomal protein L22 [Candidatus Woesebacteria bacterium]|jgi:large subunit ribosomal protein L22